MIETRESAGLDLDLRDISKMDNDTTTNSSPKTRISRKNGKSNTMNQRSRKKGLAVTPLFTRPGVDPFDEIEWDKRRAVIKNDKGEVVFESNEIEVPKAWSMLATNIVASKYFYGAHGMDTQEKSLRQLVHRVARTITDWGMRDGYFETTADADTFYRELAYICANQYGAFNSPVWFNVGLHQVYGLTSANKACYYWNPDAAQIERTSDSYKHPQSSACFIQSVADSMEDIMRLAGSEAMLFKYGSGTGTDLSTLRSSREKLSGGGVPSGPLSFMRVFDQVAAVIKSGGKTRRAAKMQSLKVDHPDIVEFIQCKVNEEKKARALIKAGYDGSFNGEAYSSVMFQNANLSVRVSDEFMKAVEAGTVWHTRAVTTGDIVEVLEAKTVLQNAAEAAHFCGDPGLQYDTTINRWHTCPASGRINASNPCSEYMFVDNSACNLASINLTKFSDAQHVFDVQRFQHVARILIIAQDILVDNGSYPTREIAENSHLFRPLGLGYANLGALIMSLGKPYDSDEGRAFASDVTALLTSYAYKTSAEIAAIRGPFEEYAKNSDAMMAVLGMHRESLSRVKHDQWISPLTREAHQAWDHAIEAGRRFGFRNAQVTVLAPTGTIGFMMDCDTTGVEPDIALVKYKQMADGGLFKIINQTLPIALKRLGYTSEQIAAILAHVNEHDTIEEAPGLDPEHLKVFDCAFKPKKGSRFIDYHAHLKMMAAVQPFLSGAISKTINMPTTATAQDVFQVYMDGWKLGLKAVAIYRDGSKGIQPVTTSKAGNADEAAAPGGAESLTPSNKPFRHRMPLTRQSITHKFEVGGHQGYLTVGLYEDGTPGELFITMAKEGSTVGGIMDAFGTAISMCLQYGVPFSTLIDKFCHSRFEPSGFTKNPEIPYAKSLVDYIFRWLELTFPDGRNKTMRLLQPMPTTAKPKSEAVLAAAATSNNEASMPAAVGAPAQFKDMQADAPPCDKCGAITVRNGACYRCFNCGNSMGCS